MTRLLELSRFHVLWQNQHSQCKCIALIAIADFLKMHDVKLFCLKFSEENFTIENCLEMMVMFTIENCLEMVMFAAQ